MPDQPESSGHALTARFARFAEYDPDETDGDTLTWYVRGRNVLVAYTEADTGAVLASGHRPGEYVVLLPETRGAVHVRAAKETVEVPGASLAVVPPGPSEIRVDGRMPVVRLFPAQSLEEADGASAEPEPQLDGDLTDRSSIRCHDLSRPPELGSTIRLWRSPTLLVACPDPARGPVDPASVVPRHYPDAERYALVLRGEFVHRVRQPGVAGDPVEEEQERCGAPSLAIIPPKLVNSSQAVGPGLNEMVEVYCPPPAGGPYEPD
ncbi:MAG: hypothetical protein J2P40_01565 [Candidatus Dormibacteraeota bacterium]|nr:hypothetical protein [Candidatus Dormibacteraeota bacterium]MBO0704824.1 hypothetical protein [Candidatus Dormibacteraeota bacterium]MBO0759938.1 hypothetical protein [Candidatus Dormibacteraeota bacterium]